MAFRDSANAPMCAASGPSGARDRTTWLLITHVTVDPFPPDTMVTEGVKTMSGQIRTYAGNTTPAWRDKT